MQLWEKELYTRIFFEMDKRCLRKYLWRKAMSTNQLEKIPDVTEEEWLQVNNENRKYAEEFLKQMVQLSPQTLKQYTSGLHIFFRYVKENLNDKHFTEIKPRDFMMYQNWLVGLGQSSAAIRLKRSSISSFNQYIESYYPDEFPNYRSCVTKKTPAPIQVLVNEKEPLTLEEYDHLCNELEKKELWQPLAYLMFSFSSGARRGEVRQLLKEVINYEPKESSNGSVSYLSHSLRCKGRGKAGKVRKLQFDERAMNALKKWLDKRGNDDCPYVFVSKEKEKYRQVAPETLNGWCKNYFEPIVGRRVHPHLFRETRATSMVVEQGKDIKTAQKLLGHLSSTTTETYIIRKDEDASDDAFS
jgi:integrase